jgi:3'-phosphoadenosine 5'-phosphosulfate sulfotransferase (PAPS reductase)/FAD synthetase
VKLTGWDSAIKRASYPEGYLIKPGVLRPHPAAYTGRWAAMQKSLAIINEAIDTFQPYKVFALFSGGNDSVCSVHIASHAKQFDGAVFIDTGIKIQQTLDHARATAERFGWNFQIVQTPESYDKIVKKYGFPGASAHRYMYIMLKERALDRLMRETKTHRNQSIMLITGVRQHESARRMKNVTGAVVKQKSRVWVAPLWDWTDEVKAAYMAEYNLPQNPVKPIMHISGDCLCGAYNDKGDLQMLKAFYPQEAERIEKLQTEVMKTHPWAWDEMPPKWWRDYKNGQRFLSDEFLPLCWQCDNLAAQHSVQRTGGESGQQNLFSAGEVLPAKVTAKSPRR